MHGFLDQNRFKGDSTNSNDPQQTNTSSYELVLVYLHNVLLKTKQMATCDALKFDQVINGLTLPQNQHYSSSNS